MRFCQGRTEGAVCLLKPAGWTQADVSLAVHSSKHSGEQQLHKQIECILEQGWIMTTAERILSGSTVSETVPVIFLFIYMTFLRAPQTYQHHQVLDA